MKKRIFLNNTIYQNSESDLTKLVHALKIDQEFQKGLIPTWKLFTKSRKGLIQKQAFKQYIQDIYAFLINFLPTKNLEELAEEECIKLTRDDKEFLSYGNFCEFFAYLAFLWVENCDRRSAIGFVKMLFESTTKLVARSVEDGTERHIPLDLQVSVKERKTVEQVYNEDLQLEIYTNTLYYESVVQRNKEIETKYQTDHKFQLERKILNLNEIIPLGFSCECLLSHIRNNNFQNSEVCNHIPKKTIKGLNDVKILPVLSEEDMEAFKQADADPRPLIIVPILNHYISDSNEGPNFYRINSLVAHPISFEQLKNKSGETEYFNLISDFFESEEYDIDRIQQMQSYYETKKQRKQEQKENIKTNKKVPKDFNEFSRNLHFDLLKNIQQYLDNTKLLNTLKDFEKKERDNTIGQSTLKFPDFISSKNNLPFDTLNAFQDDIIEYANQNPLQILILGKPKIGKTTFCQIFSKNKQIDIEHIEVQKLIEGIFKKKAEFDENPEMDENGEPKDIFSKTEKSIMEDLENGNAVKPLDLLELVNMEFRKETPKNKGFILDLPLSCQNADFCWIEAIISNKLQLPKIGCRYFSHIIEFVTDNEDVHDMAANIMERPENVRLYSQYDRDLLRKPKPQLAEGEEEEPVEEDPDDESKIKVDEKDLVFRANDNKTTLTTFLENYESKTKQKIKEFCTHLTKNEHISISTAGKNADEIVDIAITNLGNEVFPSKPLAKKLEGAGEKDLLTQGIEETKMVRKWSPWQQIDPVDLLKGIVELGKAGEFAAEYAGRVFVFSSEENQNAFVANPRKYLKSPPKLPKTYNVAIIGPRKAGKKTMGNLLCRQYGWKHVDIQQIICDKLDQQKEDEQEAHKPSNYEPRADDVHLSEHEWKDFFKGNSLSAKDIWPVILHEIGVPLQKKPEGWGIEKTEEGEGEENQEEDKKKKEAPKKKKKEVKKEDDDERPKTPPVEDLKLAEIIQKVEPEVNKEGKQWQQPVQGLLIIGQPMTEEQFKEMKKCCNISFDRVVILSDKSEEEENSGKTLMKREGFEKNCNLESEMAVTATASTVLKELIGEEKIKEIPISGTVEEVYNNIRTAIDPFFIKADDDGFVKVAGDVDEEGGDFPLTWGEYGPFCPVTLKDDGWLIPGKEFEAIVRGTRHKFFSEDLQAKFKARTYDYIKGPRIKVPPPRVMIVGVRGSGVKTQLKNLHNKYKIPVFEFEKNFLSYLKNEKQKRRNDRIFNKGFKPPEEGAEGEEPAADPEIEDEDPAFDKLAHEIDVVKKVFSGVNECFINGNFFNVDPEKDTETPFTQLLVDSRKLPEVVVILKVDEANYLKREFDTKSIEEEYNRLMEERKKQKQLEKEEARKKAIEELEEGQQLPEEEPEADEEDPDAPKLDEMIKEAQEKYTARRTADEETVTALGEALKEHFIDVIEVDANRGQQQVFDKINYSLRSYIQQRQDKLERYQCYKLKKQVVESAEEEEKPDRLLFFENSYTYKKSRYGDRNPLTMLQTPIIRDFPMLYRDRIYYFGSEDEVDRVCQQPVTYLKNKSYPNDVTINPIVFIVGKPKSGKSALAKLLEEKLNIVRIKLSQIIEDYAPEHKYIQSKKAMDTLKEGSELTDELIVELILNRTRQADCQKNGWVLDGYPKTMSQALLFAKAEIIPCSVFSLQTKSFSIKQKTTIAAKKDDKVAVKFGYNPIIIHNQLSMGDQELVNLENFYINTFNNMHFLDAKISKWGLFDSAKQSINEAIMCRQNFARSLITDEPVQISNLALTREQLLANLDQDFTVFSPVTLKSKNEFQQGSIRNNFCVYFDRYIYVVNSQEEVNDFLKSPDLYVFQKINDYNPPKQIVLDEQQQKWQKVTQKGYCIIELFSNILKKSAPNLLVDYKGKVFSFSNSKNMIQFLHQPYKYENVSLPFKLPVQNEKKNLVKKIAKAGDCTAFLEHHLGNIAMRVLAQLGYKRIKYPTINCKETALKFIAISLKAQNPNQDEAYRQKYQAKLNEFLKHCAYSQEISEEFSRKGTENEPIKWEQWDEENLLKITQEFSDFRNVLDNEEKEAYFAKFIR